MRKEYVIDTNILLDDPNCIEILRNGDENIIYIPIKVLMELDNLKHDDKTRHLVAQAITKIEEHRDSIQFIGDVDRYFQEKSDLQILNEVLENNNTNNPILVTNDRIFRILAGLKDIQSEQFKLSNPFKSESQLYTGIVKDEREIIPNCFTWFEGKPILHKPSGPKVIDYENVVWKTKPRTVHQNLALELMLDPDIPIVSLQSEAGYGKTHLALATALHLVLKDKDAPFKKIYIVKPIIEIGRSMGFLPGDVEEKMEPYVRYISNLILKLHDFQPANKIFLDPQPGNPKFDPKRFEILPLAYIRGMTIENAFVIIDEMQNMSRYEARALLTRMGENVKCICLGDTRQVDNYYLNEYNNALNWIVKCLKGDKHYAHLVLKGTHSRGAICDMVLRSGL